MNEWNSGLVARKGRMGRMGRVYNMKELEIVISFTYLLLAHSDKLQFMVPC